MQSVKNVWVLQSSAKTGFMDVPEHHGLSLGQRAVSRNALGHGLGDRGGSIPTRQVVCFQCLWEALGKWALEIQF